MLSKKFRFFYLSLHAQTETLSQQNANTTNLKADFRMSICGSNFQTEWIQYLSYGKKIIPRIATAFSSTYPPISKLRFLLYKINATNNFCVRP